MKVCTLFVSLVCLLGHGSQVSIGAGEFWRAGSFEIGGIIGGYTGESMDGRINGVPGELELDDLFIGGFNFGYNITDQLNVNLDVMFSEADLTFSNSGGTLRDDADLFIFMVNLDYYILPTEFTPYVSAGVGFLSMSNEYDDEWYCCFFEEQEISVKEVNFLWNVGAGVRWDPIEHLYLKLGYRLSGTELEYADDYMFLHSVLLTVGYNFRQ